MATYGTIMQRKLQFGREATAGTAVPATVLFRGLVETIDDTSPVVHVEEHTGVKYSLGRTYIPYKAATLTQPSQEATWELFPHILEAGLNAESPTQDGAGDGYIREYELEDDTNVPKTYTIESGDNIDGGEMEYGFVSHFVLSGRINEALKFAADWHGRQFIDGAFTAALTAPTVEDMLFNKSKLYIDNVADGFGANQRTGIFQSFTLDVATGLVPVFAGDGELYFAGMKCVTKSAMLTLIYEHETYVATERTAKRDQTPRAVRIENTGSAFTVGGTTYANKTLIIDAAGKYESFGVLEQAGDGDNVVTAVLKLSYDSTVAQMLKFLHVVDDAAL